MNTNETVCRYAKIMAVKEVFSTHPYWHTSNYPYPHENVLADWFDVVVNNHPPSPSVRTMCESIHDVTDGATAYDIEDALDTDGDMMYTLTEQYEFSEPYALLEEKYQAFEAHLTEFIKYLKEQS
jgi:hypothetical protein